MVNSLLIYLPIGRIKTRTNGYTSNNTFQPVVLNSELKLKISEYHYLKDLMPITFSSPRAQPQVAHFLISNESPLFF